MARLILEERQGISPKHNRLTEALQFDCFTPPFKQVSSPVAPLVDLQHIDTMAKVPR